ncbi:hypothetical protein ACL02P_02545 [Paenibacillus sp. MB22_1]|uniref:Import inner membrane translocase subunit Tim44 n=1 Tax=Ruminiclostridium papyrosolvens C7 TaxID=1330534 RepID=U4R0E9_9FIRM|nr:MULTISPECIES: hypothetical protein [Bacillota]EES73691.1 hypothetical protein POTG_01398 [Paenibacillus sp. oral taxon 786 str. D14]EPR10679.1 hypothetical protein L323_12365 [Ruminiclostridium papyrosolvens C7]MCT2194880.1 hypothetical protein [Paenibacillus sp. p3-SID1389]
MLKRIMLLMMVFTVFFTFTAPDFADARRGGFKSGPRSYNPTPKKPSQSEYQNTTGNRTGTQTGTPTTNRGFFSGGSFMRGMMIGGLAGLLFGGLFSSMGFFGNLLGLAVNLLAIYVIIAAAMALYRRFKKQPRHDDYRNGGRY